MSQGQATLGLDVQIAPRHPKGLSLANPVMIASGTFGWDGYGRGLPEDFALHRLGAVVVKSVTMKPRAGNPEPRWYPKSFQQAVAAGECIFLNSVGIANPGIEAVLGEKAPMWATWKAPVILSLAGESVEQFGEMASMAEGVQGIVALELNLSCPNVEGGLLFSQDPHMTEATVRRVKQRISLPIIAKLGPNVADIVAIARAAVSAGADALTLINTMPAMVIDVESRKPVLGAVTGGLSGPGLRPIAVAAVYKVAQAVDVPVIGVGGIFKAQDALEFIMAGATAVQVGSANLADFLAPFHVLEGLEEYLVRHEINHISELVGVVLHSKGK